MLNGRLKAWEKISGFVCVHYLYMHANPYGWTKRGCNNAIRGALLQVLLPLSADTARGKTICIWATRKEEMDIKGL